MTFRTARLGQGCYGQEVRGVYAGPDGRALYVSRALKRPAPRAADHVIVARFRLDGRPATLYGATPARLTQHARAVAPWPTASQPLVELL